MFSPVIKRPICSCRTFAWTLWLKRFKADFLDERIVVSKIVFRETDFNVVCFHQASSSGSLLWQRSPICHDQCTEISHIWVRSHCWPLLSDMRIMKSSFWPTNVQRRILFEVALLFAGQNGQDGRRCFINLPEEAEHSGGRCIVVDDCRRIATVICKVWPRRMKMNDRNHPYDDRTPRACWSG